MNRMKKQNETTKSKGSQFTYDDKLARYTVNGQTGTLFEYIEMLLCSMINII
jgi:phage baseplate assembly protein gpV